MSVLPPQRIDRAVNPERDSGGQGLGAGGVRVLPLPEVPTWIAGADDLVPFPPGPWQRGSQLDPVPGAPQSPHDHSAAVSYANRDSGVGGCVPSGVWWLFGMGMGRGYRCVQHECLLAGKVEACLRT